MNSNIKPLVPGSQDQQQETNCAWLHPARMSSQVRERNWPLDAMGLGCGVVCHPVGQFPRGRVNPPRGQRYTPAFHDADCLLNTVARLALNVRCDCDTRLDLPGLRMQRRLCSLQG